MIPPGWWAQHGTHTLFVAGPVAGLAALALGADVRAWFRRHPRDLTLLPAALLSSGAGIIWPAWHIYQSQIEWRGQATQLLAQRRGIAAIETAVRTQLEALPNHPSWQKLFHTTGEGTAVIALQTEVNSALNGARVRPQSFAPLEVMQAGPLRKVGLRIVAPMTIDQLGDVLIRVEALTHWVRIEQLSVNAPPVQSAQENPTLIVTMDAVGYAIDAGIPRQ
mgnify:CR=1 FL=1